MKTNKRGGTDTKWFALIIAVLIVSGIGVYYFGFKGSVNENPKGITTAGGCDLSPSVLLTSVDKLQTGTAVTVASNYSQYNGVYVGSIPSSLTSGSDLKVLITATGYLNAVSEKKTIGCGSNNFLFSQYAYGAPTYKVYDANFNALSDSIAGGTVNETNSANTITDILKISGTPLKSTGDMLVVVEVANNTQVASSGISLKGATSVDVPQWYTTAGAGSATKAFLIPAIVNGGSVSYDLSLSPRSGQTIGTTDVGVYTTIYTLNPVVLDTVNGQFLTSNTWQDVDGTNKTIGDVDYDYLIQ